MLDAPICNMSRRAQRDPWKCMQLLNWRFEQTEEIAHKTADVRCLKYVWSSIQTNHQVGATWPNTLRTQSNTHSSCHNVCQLEYCSLMNICVCALDRSIECVCFCIKLRLLHCSFVLLFITHTHTLFCETSSTRRRRFTHEANLALSPNVPTCFPLTGFFV